MAELLKDIYFTEDSIRQIGELLLSSYPDFNTRLFFELVFSDDFQDKELKQKMSHLTHSLRASLPKNYTDAIEVLKKVAPFISGFEAMALPDFVEKFGMTHWKCSMDALEWFTRFSSSEFAVRPFLIQSPEKMMTQMSDWADHSHENIRRLASEGCRPRLPWAMALPIFIDNPKPVITLLEKLKNDPSDMVRRSVANNLNDISKDNPDIALAVFETWIGDTSETDWIIKHASRTLLKAGDPRAMRLFGFHDPELIQISSLSVEPPTISIGDSVQFKFKMGVMSENTAKIRLEYAVFFVKAKGTVSKKVFQIREGEYTPGDHPFTRNHTFKDMSTRKHYPGTHDIVILINGVEKAKTQIHLTGELR